MKNLIRKCNVGCKTEKQEYKVHIHYEGCICYIVSADSDEDAKETALTLFGNENPDKLINGLEYDVCDCKLFNRL